MMPLRPTLFFMSSTFAIFACAANEKLDEPAADTAQNSNEQDASDDGGSDEGGSDDGGSDDGGSDEGGSDEGDSNEDISDETDSNEDVSEQDDNSDVEDAVTLDEIHEEILGPKCGGGYCHEQGPDVQGILNLTQRDDLRDHLLDASIELPSMPRITPGDLEQSYLWHKVKGTHHDVGGNGFQMPLDGDPLSDSEVAQIEEWILGGALL